LAAMIVGMGMPTYDEPPACETGLAGDLSLFYMKSLTKYMYKTKDFHRSLWLFTAMEGSLSEPLFLSIPYIPAKPTCSGFRVISHG